MYPPGSRPAPGPKAIADAPTCAWAHWSITDPVPAGDNAAFDHVLQDLNSRMTRLAPAVHHPTEGDRP